MESIGRRFLQIFELKGYKTKTEFAKEFGVSKSAPEHWFSGQTEPAPKHIIRMFMLHPDINKNWLLFGDEPALLNQEKKLSIVEVRAEMIERENAILKEYIKTLEYTVSLLKEKH